MCGSRAYGTTPLREVTVCPFFSGAACYDAQLYQQLVPIDSKVPVVETHTATWGLFKPHRRGGMRIHPELEPFLELVLLSFIICLRERRTESPCD